MLAASNVKVTAKVKNLIVLLEVKITNHKSQNHNKVFPYLLIPMKDIIYYYLLIRYYIIYMNSPFLCIEIPYYDFVICDLCDC